MYAEVKRKILPFCIRVKPCSSQTFILSSCSPWGILLVSGLWCAQINLLQAMDKNEPIESLAIPKKLVGFYQDKNHPLTQGLWQNQDLSVRLQKIIHEIESKNNELLKSKKNSLNISDQDLEKYKKILTPAESNPVQIQQLYNNSPYNALLLASDAQKDINNGRSGNKVVIWSRGDKKILVLKRFKPENIKGGIQELWYSLISLKNNPWPQELKIVRIYDAFFCSENFLNIVMEPANGEDINQILGTNSPESGIKAFAKYLALFHSKNSRKLNKEIDKEKYITHAAQPLHTLVDDPLKDEDKNPELKLLRLIKSAFTLFTQNESIKSDNILKLLSAKKQEEFINITRNICDKFIENSSEIYRSIIGDEKKHPYFLTLTHGDAHKDNFFYDDTETLGNSLALDSPQRITMIDFEGIIKTYGYIGDPAEDVGRFLGSIWDWAVQEESGVKENLSENQKFSTWRDQFFETYLETIEKSAIIRKEQFNDFARIFIENSKFYELRFYRALFNAQKGQDFEKDKNIKLKILESWIKENSALANSLEKTAQNTTIKDSKNRPWTSVSGLTNCCIPDHQSEEFIESASEGSNKSYLTLLWEELHRKGTATLSSTAAIAGMGGIGKTSLALEYAHEAKKNKAYNLIYWLQSGSEFFLLKSYRELLLEITEQKLHSIIQNADFEYIVELVKKHVPQKDRSLLIYDNVPDSTFLKDRVPQANTHILITSRYSGEWERPPLMLNVFRVEDSINYVLKVTGLKATVPHKNIAEELAEKLGNLPLALSHAAHYIKLVGGRNVSEETFKEYLTGFKDITVAYFEDNRNIFKNPDPEITYAHLIARTLRMTKIYLSQLNSRTIADLAETLMGYCAYLDSNSLVDEIFPEYKTNPGEIKEALSLLASLSIIKNVKDMFSFSMHRLEQLVIREELKEKKHHQDIFSKISSTFYNLFINKTTTEEDINKLTNYLPHIRSLIEHSKRPEFILSDVDYLEWIGRILYAFSATKIIDLNSFFVCHKEGEALKIPDTVQAKIETDVQTEGMPQIFRNFKIFFENPIKDTDVPDWLIELTKSNHPIVSYNLAHMFYYDGFFINNNFIKAFNFYFGAAEQGYAKAQRKLSALYVLGKGVEQNHYEAFKWCKKAAKQGDIEACQMLGLMYYNGDCVEKDLSEAFEWSKKAAEQGNFHAQFDVGVMYNNGIGVTQNYEEALKWYKKAAEKEHPKAQTNIGLMYENGKGVQPDPNEAIKWYTLAAQQGDPTAQFNLGLMYRRGKDVIQNYKKSFKYLTMAAEQGSAAAQTNLGLMHYKGEGRKQDFDEAFKCFSKAALQKHPEAQYNLGLMHAKGEGTSMNMVEALECYTLAARQGYLMAQYNLGVFYKSIGTPEGNARAMKWYTKAAAQGSIDAQFNLGAMYAKVMNDLEAIKWYTAAAQQGDIEAQYIIGIRYAEGRGAMKDYTVAIKWLTIPAEQGYKDAQSRLQLLKQEVEKQEICSIS